MGMKRIGNWRGVSRVIRNLQGDMRDAQRITLKRFGLKVERIAVTHISKQDLGWKRLKPSTIASNIRQGYSENILVETSLYFQSITSWVDNDAVYAGVSKTIRTRSGTLLANVAEVHEFGSRSGNIPARPLWQPSFKEAIEWMKDNNNPAEIFLQKLKRRL